MTVEFVVAYKLALFALSCISLFSSVKGLLDKQKHLLCTEKLNIYPSTSNCAGMPTFTVQLQ
jgi:hypothetical protein